MGTTYPDRIVVSITDDDQPAPDGMTFLGPFYIVDGYSNGTTESSCLGVQFTLPIRLILGYDPNELPIGAPSPFLAYHDEQGGWRKLASDPGRVAEVGKVSGLVQYTTPVSILVEIPPANYQVSNLNVAPSVTSIGIGDVLTLARKIGENVTVTADVTNSGGQVDKYTVNLKINEQIMDSARITVGPNQSEGVSFTVALEEPGWYVVQIGGVSGEFRTWTWINWWFVGGLCGGLALLSLGLWYVIAKWRRRTSARTGS
jgi:hypothetical protein